MQISQNQKKKVPEINRDEMKVRKLILKYKENFFPKSEKRIHDDSHNPNEILNKLINEKENVDILEGKY